MDEQVLVIDDGEDIERDNVFKKIALIYESLELPYNEHEFLIKQKLFRIRIFCNTHNFSEDEIGIIKKVRSQLLNREYQNTFRNRLKKQTSQYRNSVFKEKDFEQLKIDYERLKQDNDNLKAVLYQYQMLYMQQFSDQLQLRTQQIMDACLISQDNII